MASWILSDMSAALVQLGTLQDASRAQQLLLHCSTSQKLELLDSVFKANLYKPQDVVKHGRDLLKRGYLGNAKYRIQEQTCVACIDIGLWADADEIIKSLKQSFPQSIRVKRLEGLLLEARPAAGEQKYDRARKLYDEILKADEANLLTHKRKVAMYQTPPPRSAALPDWTMADICTCVQVEAGRQNSGGDQGHERGYSEGLLV